MSDDEHDLPPTGPGLSDEAVARGMEAVQSAAKEMIAAARTLLDVAEELVQDPNAASTMLGALSSVARAATNFAPGRPTRADGSGEDDDDDGGVRRIPVS